MKRERKTMQSGKVIANIETIVNDLKPITWKQVLYEAVTNAIQSDATEIKINLFVTPLVPSSLRWNS